MLVALRKESVDRNTIISQTVSEVIGSLSARRAWIEIRCRWVTLTYAESLSARRAWIEIAILGIGFLLVLVALRKESVDRNTTRMRIIKKHLCRSPQGERG